MVINIIPFYPQIILYNNKVLAENNHFLSIWDCPLFLSDADTDKGT